MTNVTVNLIEPGSRYGDRINQLDFRVAKLLRFGGKRTMLALDLYNALNSNRDPDLQQHVRAGRHVAAAERDPDTKAVPHQRRVHLLMMPPGVISI